MPVNLQNLVRVFHHRFGFPIADQPTLPPEEVAALRIRLIEEEAAEFRDAASRRDVVAVADALADLLYVTYGAAVTYGIDLNEVAAEVHRSNMTKQGSANGKAVKGPGYQPPDIAPLLATPADCGTAVMRHHTQTPDRSEAHL